MGRVMEKIRISNVLDVMHAERGDIPADQVRRTEIDALVDTGATSLVLPEALVAKLGLEIRGHNVVRYADGRADTVPRVTVHLEILGRPMTCDALVVPGRETALIGQIPLELLDLRVDPRNQRIYVNPESPDEPLWEILEVA